MSNEPGTPPQDTRRTPGCLVALGIIALVILVIIASTKIKGLIKAANPTATLPSRGWVTLDDSEKTWTVNHPTSMYADADSFDAAQLGTLEVGDTLKLPSGVKTLTCKNVSEGGITMRLCRFYAPSLAKTGWVLQKWVDD